MFGTLADFDDLIADTHALGIKVIVDLVPNHTSDQHAWFAAALAAPSRQPRARPVRLPRRPRPDNTEPPNDWQSVFGGPRGPGDRGRRPPGQWYLHLFAPEQPDLNWTNHDVLDEFDSILRFWLDRGVDGFRVDVAHGMAKTPTCPTSPGPTGRRAGGGGPSLLGPGRGARGLPPVATDRRRVPARVTFVGEVWVQTPERLARYLRPDELHTAFNFDFLLAPWGAVGMRPRSTGASRPSPTSARPPRGCSRTTTSSAT